MLNSDLVIDFVPLLQIAKFSIEILKKKCLLKHVNEITWKHGQFEIIDVNFINLDPKETKERKLSKMEE